MDPEHSRDGSVERDYIVYLTEHRDCWTLGLDTGTGAVEGSGLGLSIVEESVRLLGGQIRAHSVEGQGTAFYITVPNRWLV
jgi:signal transduction histidine kinase